MNKFLYLSATLFLGLNLFSQENLPNQEYLESLPDDVRSQILGQNVNTEDVYKNPKTRLETLERELETAATLLSRIQFEVSKNDAASNTSLARYGEDFFNSFQSTFRPISEVAVDFSYVLDAGDFLTVQYVGEVNKKEKVAVQRDGSINLAEYGKLYLKGLTFKEARDLINVAFPKSTWC